MKLIEQQFSISLIDIFKRLHQIKIRNSIKQVYWKFLNKCLPINKQLPQICPHDNSPDDHSHFILNCKLVNKIIKQSNKLWTDLTKKDSIFTPKKIPLLEGATETERIYSAAILWTLWIAHNK